MQVKVQQPRARTADGPVGGRHLPGRRPAPARACSTPPRDIAELIGTRLGLPVQAVAADTAAGHFGWIGTLVGVDAPASSELTRELMDWRPSHPGLLNDLATGEFFTSPS